MIDIEKWQEIVKTLGKHKVRTTLTAFGVFWGIFMLTVLLGIAKGLENATWKNFPEVKNTIYVWVKNATQIPYKGLPEGRHFLFKPEDVKAIEDNVESVGFIRGKNEVGQWGATPPLVVNPENRKNSAFNIEGTHAGMIQLNSMKLLAGRGLNEFDDLEERKVAIIGNRVKEQLFSPNENPVGQRLLLNNISFLVIGVFESTFKGNQKQEEEKLYIPNSTLRKTFNQMDFIGSLVVLPKPNYSSFQAEADVREYLSKIKNVHPKDTEVFGSYNMQKDFDQVNGLFAGISAFSWMVAIGTILAGVIGVGNIMLIVVKERTREIGIRKALGATNGSVILMILQESLLLTAVSGYVGLVVGVLTVEGINMITTMMGDESPIHNPSVDLTTATWAFIVLIIAGVLTSILPASKAASVNPIVALQDE